MSDPAEQQPSFPAVFEEEDRAMNRTVDQDIIDERRSRRELHDELRRAWVLLAPGDGLALQRVNQIFTEHHVWFRQGLLSQMQCLIMDFRVEMRPPMSYDEIKQEFDISSDKVVITCLIRTAFGRYWPKPDGGRDEYLSPPDLLAFAEVVRQKTNEFDCITREEACTLAYNLNLQRRRRAQKMLAAAQCTTMRHLKECGKPTCEWLYKVAEELNLKICRPQAIEDVRRIFCDIPSITSFFQRFGDVIRGRHPLLVFNMDETQLSAQKHLRVLTTAGHLPLKKSQGKLPHLTGLVTISAGGACFRPIVILPDLLTLKTLTKFEHLTSFATSGTGWITADLFLMFALDFCAQLTQYRLTLPQPIANDRVLLILDGHGTRANLIGLMIFHAFNVDVLILPGHTTHVLQAFDVCVASPLKTEFKKLLQARLEELLHLPPGSRMKAAKLREIIVGAFLDALHKATSPGNLESAFATTGFVPLDPTRPLQSPFVSEGPDGVFEGIRTKPNPINAELLTHPVKLNEMFRGRTGRDMQPQDLMNINLAAQWQRLRDARPAQGKALSPMPTFFVQGPDGQFKKYSG
jgi:hypothetical protein